MKRTFSLLSFLKETVFTTHGLPLFMSLFVLGLLLVVFRMKGVELDYKYSELDKKLNHIFLEKKELDATKANLTSVGNLKVFAKKYSLKEPKSNQIIVVP